MLSTNNISDGGNKLEQNINERKQNADIIFNTVIMIV